MAAAQQIATPTAQGQYQVHLEGMCEVLADKGYHSGPTLVALGDLRVRSYVSVPQQPRRNWENGSEQKFDDMGSLGGFPENNEFGLGCRHPLDLQQEVAKVLVNHARDATGT